MKGIKQFFMTLSLLAMANVGLHAQDLIVEGGSWFDTANNAFVSNSGILIKEGSFVKVGASLSTEESRNIQKVILGEDDYILPGIIDLHAHHNLNLFGRKRKDETNAYPVLFLANGVTSTFPAGEYDPEDMMQLRLDINSGRKIGPRLLNSGPYFGGARIGWNRNTTAEEIYAEVDLWVERGVSGFKAKQISPEHLKPLIERAHHHGLTVTGHLGSGFRNSVNPRDAIALGIDRIEHFLGGDAMPATQSAYASLVDFHPDMPEFKTIVDLYLKSNTNFDATITAYGYFGERTVGYDYWVDEKRYFTPFVQEYRKEHSQRRKISQFDKIYWVKRKTIKAFYDAGAEHLITLGTDHASTGEYISGFSAHRELEAFVLSGIPPAAAIRFATINSANALKLGDKLGSLESGKFADLFVTKGNPLDDIKNTRNVYLVVKGGKLYKTAELLESVEGKLGPKNAEEAKEW